MNSVDAVPSSQVEPAEDQASKEQRTSLASAEVESVGNRPKHNKPDVFASGQDSHARDVCND